MYLYLFLYSATNTPESSMLPLLEDNRFLAETNSQVQRVEGVDGECRYFEYQTNGTSNMKFSFHIFFQKNRKCWKRITVFSRLAFRAHV